MESFVNFSNHPSCYWSDFQKETAEKYGNIVDILFPDVPANLSENEIMEMGTKIVEEILSHNPKAVMCQGEFTLTFDVVTKLKSKGVTCLSACSERVSTEKRVENGLTHKESIFSFVRFRQY